MEVKMKTVVAIGLLGLCIPFAIIQSRRGVSENRVDGQMDSDVAVNLPGAGKKKKPKIQNVVDASGMTQSPSESSDVTSDSVSSELLTGWTSNFQFLCQFAGFKILSMYMCFRTCLLYDLLSTFMK